MLNFLKSLFAVFFAAQTVENSVQIGEQNDLLPVEPVRPLEAPKADLWIETALYVGLTRPDKTRIKNRDFIQFCNQFLTPNFPDGSTILEGRGQWLDVASNRTISEDSRTIVVVYPASQAQAKDKALNAISQAYCKAFSQDAVLRTDKEIKVSFVSAKVAATA